MVVDVSTFCFLTVVFSVVVALLGVFIFTAIRRNFSSSSSSSLSDELSTLLSFSKVSLHFGSRFLFLLRGSLPKSVPLDFGLDTAFALYFYHQYYYKS